MGDADQSAQFKAFETGPLEIRVSTIGGWVGSYHLRALAATGEPGAAWDAAGEPNTSCVIANPLAVGAVRRDTIYAPDPRYIRHLLDGNAYRVTLAAGQRYLVTVSDPSTTARWSSVSLSLIDSRGSLLGDPVYPGPHGEALHYQLPAGVQRIICIQVGSYADFWNGDYTISIAALSDHQHLLFLPALQR